MRPRRKHPHQFLVTQTQIRKFLLAIANGLVQLTLPGPEINKAVRLILDRYPQFFLKPPEGVDPITAGWLDIDRVQQWLRLAWLADPKSRERSWYIFRARMANFNNRVLAEGRIRLATRKDGTVDGKLLTDLVHGLYTPENQALDEQMPPLSDPMEQALYYFQLHATHAKRCTNLTCPAPYFFATRKGQEACSPDCAAEMKRIANREWWRRNRMTGESR
jgi:hypothetical protein